MTSGVEQEISTMNKELLEIQESMASLKKAWVLCSLLPNKSLELSFQQICLQELYGRFGNSINLEE